MAEKAARHTVVVAYDIPEDRRRSKLHDALGSFGDRVQYSVFECRVTPAELRRLRETVRRLTSPRQDSVILYHLCVACRERIEPVPRRAPPVRKVVRIV